MPERRMIATAQLRLEKRSDDKAPTIIGYAAVFARSNDPSTEYQLFESGRTKLIERVMPTAFNRALAEKHDVRALFNHDIDRMLGRTTSGTLRLSVDNIGLRYEIDPPDTDSARELVTLISRGDISGSSFSFDVPTPEGEEFVDDERGGNLTVYRELRDVDIFDVGPVVFPAYAGTSAGMRSDPSFATEARSAYDRYCLRAQRAKVDRKLAQVAKIEGW